MIKNIKNRLVLIGYRGTGKTTVGKKLSQLLEWDYVSIDELIEEEVGMTILNFVSKKGWEEFRKIEKKVIAGLRNVSRAVIDCGGGVVEDEKNMAALVPKSWVAWVDAEKSDIYQRLQRAGDRPLLEQTDLMMDIEIYYDYRLPLYKKNSDIYVNSSSDSVEDICVKIMNEIL